MNSYNENLHATVVASLESQAQDLKQIHSQANASMFTLYYAQGALVTANSKLLAAQGTLNDDAAIKEQAVSNSNLSNNLLGAANQAGQYLKQSVTNTAMSASNVQIANKAILQLASDIGSIYSIVQAADFETEIHFQAREARKLMNDTAYEAELASQLALEASVLTSKVTVPTVADKAKANNIAVNNVLKIAAATFDTASQSFSAANTNMSSVSAAEKIAEGTLEDLSVEYGATRSAFTIANEQLNLALTATVVKGAENATFQVRFNLLKSPFGNKSKEANYPVKGYYLILAEEKKKSTFSMETAENIIQTLPDRFVDLNSLLAAKDKRFDKKINIESVADASGKSFVLKDSEGVEVKAGINYVAFIVAVFWEDYKKRLNSYDDYLSAPSQPFRFASRLAKADFSQDTTKPITENKVDFKVSEYPDFAVEYRCIFLPAAGGKSNGLFNMASFKELNKDIEDIEKIEIEYDNKITAIENDLIVVTDKIDTMRAANDEAPPSTTPDNEALTALFTKQTQFENDLQVKKAARDAAVEKVNRESRSKIDFLFNFTLAAQVAAGNYTAAQTVKADDASKDETPKTKGKDNAQKSAPAEQTGTAKMTTGWTVPVTDATTDNFGNLLEAGKNYLPVILSMSTASEDNLDMFINTWTGYIHSPVLTYTPAN